jgi:hypothetical protein
VGGKSPWISQHAKTVDITDEWIEYSNTFVAGGQPDGLVDIALGTQKGNLWLDNIRLYKGQYEEDPNLGRTERIAVDVCGKLTTAWGRIK